MKRVFVDTGAWYALIDRKDPDHIRVVKVVNQFRNRLVTSDYVFDETLTLLRYRLGWPTAHQYGTTVRSGGVTLLLRIGKNDEEAAWEIFCSYRDKSFSFTDCTSFALMKRHGIDTAVALDRDFKAYGLPCLP